MAVRVAINGLGRIGRAAFKIIRSTPGMELAAVNDLVPAEDLVYLINYDSVYGRQEKPLRVEDGYLKAGEEKIRMLNEKDPSKLPWRDLEIDIVFECSGVFTDKEGMEQHLKAGAKRVILSAPVKGPGVPTVVPGVNEIPDSDLISTASCTTNCIAPVVEIIGRRIGIKKAIMNTVHAYTSSQNIVDGPNKHIRRGRAGALNFVPTSTGAAKATSHALPQFEGKFDGTAIRGPVPVGSVADVTMITERATSMEEISKIFREEARSDRYQDIVGVVESPVVSSDIIGDAHGSFVDLEMTRVVDGDLVKIMSWYDNEWGYANQMIRAGARLAEKIQTAAVV